MPVASSRRSDLLPRRGRRSRRPHADAARPCGRTTRWRSVRRVPGQAMPRAPGRSPDRRVAARRGRGFPREDARRRRPRARSSAQLSLDPAGCHARQAIADPGCRPDVAGRTHGQVCGVCRPDPSDETGLGALDAGAAVNGGSDRIGQPRVGVDLLALELSDLAPVARAQTLGYEPGVLGSRAAARDRCSHARRTPGRSHRRRPWQRALAPAGHRHTQPILDAVRNDHRPTTTTRHGDCRLRWTVTSPNPASSIQARISDGLKLRLWLQA
jgi:hypothetical protein